MSDTTTKQLKRGWTTGACATAATKSALTALLTGKFPDPVSITLPKGQTPAFALAVEELGNGWARAGIIKDAGDDPDVTHGALIISTVRLLDEPGVVFKAGEGVGTVTKAGLPIDVGEPAINPVPRNMMREAVENLSQQNGVSGGVEIEISVRDGAEMARHTWNPRLGIVGGISILGTTGIVNPFSCSAWIASIHRGIDVARAEGLTHIAGATGSTSEASVQKLHGLGQSAMIDMGDFAGGMLKYIRMHPVKRVTVGGGLAKMTKLAQGAMDLHSGRSQVDFDMLAGVLTDLGADADLCGKARKANTVLEVNELACNKGFEIAPAMAEKALLMVRKILRSDTIDADVVIVDRNGKIIGHCE